MEYQETKKFGTRNHKSFKKKKKIKTKQKLQMRTITKHLKEDIYLSKKESKINYNSMIMKYHKIINLFEIHQINQLPQN